MTVLQNIEKDILRLTTLIKTEYPELYIFLEENPITVPSGDSPDINIKVLEDYNESLKQLLKHHIETRKKK
jgi:hypothetical protein